MEKVMLVNKEITVNNEREAKLVRVINQRIEDCCKYFDENTFGDVSKTCRVINSILTEVDVLISALYFMDVIPGNLCVRNVFDKNKAFYGVFLE